MSTLKVKIFVFLLFVFLVGMCVNEAYYVGFRKGQDQSEREADKIVDECIKDNDWVPAKFVGVCYYVGQMNKHLANLERMKK